MKTLIKKISKLFFIFLLISSSLNAQDATDFGSWYSVGVDYTLKKKLNFGVEYHMRFRENSDVMDINFTEVNLDYKLFKKFHIGGAVRFIDENDNQGGKQGIRKHFRFQFDTSYKYDIQRFTVSHRFRYQNKNEFGALADENEVPAEVLRFKTGIDYNIRKWPLDPEFSAEIFNRGNVDNSREFSKYRLTFGTSYKWKKFGKFGINYRYERSLIDGNLPMNLNIIELKYRYSIN
jgi:hypothetical protein